MKTTDSNADPCTVVRFPFELWLVLGLIAAGCTLAFLQYVAAAIDNERRALDLRIRAADLRRRYARQLRGEDAEEVIEVGEVVPGSGGAD